MLHSDQGKWQLVHMNDCNQYYLYKKPFLNTCFSFFPFEFSSIWNQSPNHCLFPFRAPFSAQIIMCTICGAKIRSSPEFCPALSVTQAPDTLSSRSSSLLSVLPLPAPSQVSWAMKLVARGFDLLSTCPGGWECQGKLSLEDGGGSCKMFSEVQQHGKGRAVEQPSPEMGSKRMHDLQRSKEQK